MTAATDYDWWAFPVQAAFTHEESGARLDVDGFWDGGRTWRVRFAPPLPGNWTWQTSSADRALDGNRGRFTVEPPSPAAVAANPNWRGHIKISGNSRYFEYADGTPFLLLADTQWAANTARCGLGADHDGPFYACVADRRRKGFTTLLIELLNGWGVLVAEPAPQRNEGGYPFLNGLKEAMNPGFWRALDLRLDSLWDAGLVAATPIAWWGRTWKRYFTIEWAERISTYLMVRYGAYNLIWAISGEYQYAVPDCGWTPVAFDRLGRAVQARNWGGRPVSIHPSGSTLWEPPHNAQSSRPYHRSGWLDHNWLQTGQSIKKLYNIATRCRENYALEPRRPVFCAEAYYERSLQEDSESAYHQRWQAWCAFLNGAAGYGYGAMGVQEFYDPDDPHGETGTADDGAECGPIPWRQGLAAPGGALLQHVRRVLSGSEWWRLKPCRETLQVNGAENPMPAATDITPPHCAAIPGERYLTYIPRGNAGRSITLANLAPARYHTAWVCPRSGVESAAAAPPPTASTWALPPRPGNPDEDWVLVLEAN